VPLDIDTLASVCTMPPGRRHRRAERVCDRVRRQLAGRDLIEEQGEQSVVAVEVKSIPKAWDPLYRRTRCNRNRRQPPRALRHQFTAGGLDAGELQQVRLGDRIVSSARARGRGASLRGQFPAQPANLASAM
jgi:hypothetical protein